MKNLCDKVSKIKNLSRQFCCIFHWLSRGVLHFFWGYCFHGEICKTKWPLFDFLEKTEKRRFWTSNFSIKTASNKIFFELILMPVPRGSFWTPGFFIRGPIWGLFLMFSKVSIIKKIWCNSSSMPKKCPHFSDTGN